MTTEYPLTKTNRIHLARAFRDVRRVDLGIECVIEGQMGKAYVDRLENPCVYKIGGFFNYFAGDAASEGAQKMLREIKPWTLFMPSAAGWLEAAMAMYGAKLISFDRYSFTTECLSLEHVQRLGQASRFASDVTRMDVAIIEKVWGQDHFIDVSEFESPSDFVERGIGYSIEKHGEIIGAAFSSLVCSKGIEISLFVSDDYRRQGIATALAAHLIKWCLENNMDPHWDAANPESCKLAEKLGYVPTGKYQSYYLKD